MFDIASARRETDRAAFDRKWCFASASDEVIKAAENEASQRLIALHFALNVFALVVRTRSRRILRLRIETSGQSMSPRVFGRRI